MSTLRAEKTTRNHDDFKVLIIGMIFSIFLMLFTPMIHTTWDTHISKRPFVSATVEIVKGADGQLYVLYDADANRQVDGVWVVMMMDANNVQLMTRRGEGSYNNNIDDPRLWSWGAFFDNDKGLNSPGVPNVPFKLCVRYVVKARSSGVSDESPQYCSQVYDPRS